MDKSTTIIGLLILLMLIGPFLYIALKSNVKKKRIEEILKENNLVLDEQDDVNGRIIALDKKKLALFFIFFEKGNEIVEIIHLAELSACRKLSEKIDDINSEPVGLVFDIKNRFGNKKTDLLFSSKGDSVSAMESAMQVANKWQAKIESLII